jgi:hypothetical protein
MKKLITILVLLLMTCFFTGCRVVKPVIPETGHYYINPDVNFSRVGKVVVFEFENLSSNSTISSTLTDSVTSSLRKLHIFTVTSLNRNDPVWRSLDLGQTDSYSIEQLSLIRRELKSDAVLFGTITQYKPYPHLMLGVHLKMVDLRDGSLLWGIEQVWDSMDQLVERRMKRFYKYNMRSGYEPMDWQLMITSPRAFNQFVVHEICETFEMINFTGRKLSSENIKNFSEKSEIRKKTFKKPEKEFKFI